MDNSLDSTRSATGKALSIAWPRNPGPPPHECEQNERTESYASHSTAFALRQRARGSKTIQVWVLKSKPTERGSESSADRPPDMC
jgi:hypothetical protein